MPAENPSLFARAIKDHLELKQRNARLDGVMPIDRYKVDDPFANHPLFKSEQQARSEETRHRDDPVDEAQESAFAPLAREERAQEEAAVPDDSGFWISDGPPEFNWGD